MYLLDTRAAKDLKEELEMLATNIDMLRFLYEGKLRTEVQEIKKESYLFKLESLELFKKFSIISYEKLLDYKQINMGAYEEMLPFFTQEAIAVSEEIFDMEKFKKWKENGEDYL